VDTLDGGAGNDTISLSHGDLVTTGTGSDNLSLYLVQNAAYEGADTTDFDPALDQMVIYFGSFDAYSMPDPLANTIVVTETSAGDTVITSTNGQVLARLTGVTGISVGLQLVQGDPLTDLAGVPTPDATYDVIILRFYEPTS
jgi:Ca2+-binding RTX toxin-like protein